MTNNVCLTEKAVDMIIPLRLHENISTYIEQQ